MKRGIKLLLVFAMCVALAVSLTACPGGGGGGNDINFAPVANAGPGQNVTPGTEVTLDGSGSSDANLDPLSYSWSFTSVPDGSSAALSDPAVAGPTFTADLAGEYLVQLIVNDGTVDSATVTVTIRGLALADTGQTTCYDDFSVQDCTGTGQDGEHSIIPMSFTDNGDSTVTDDVTGLIWQKEDDNIGYNWFEASGTYDATYNPSSTDACGSLGPDWRLPTKKELISIVNFGTYDPAVEAGYFPNTDSSGYWSSTNYAVFADHVWNTDFSDGDTDNAAMTTTKYARCVRGSSPTKSFTDNGDGTVTDNATGLIWQQCSAGQENYAPCTGTASTMLWQNALEYCNVLSLAGHSDWRLPNIKELESITDDATFFPAINKAVFPNTELNYYWSSTTQESPTFYTWTVNFGSGFTFFGSKPVTYDYVRCVR